MDEFRVGSVPPYDPIGQQHGEDARGRKRKKEPEQAAAAEEDVVTLSEHAADEEEEPGTGYGPRREQP